MAVRPALVSGHFALFDVRVIIRYFRIAAAPICSSCVFAAASYGQAPRNRRDRHSCAASAVPYMLRTLEEFCHGGINQEGRSLMRKPVAGFIFVLCLSQTVLSGLANAEPCLPNDDMHHCSGGPAPSRTAWSKWFDTRSCSPSFTDCNLAWEFV